MPLQRKSTQLGMVLITTMLLLVVVTILALAMFRAVGLEERIAGNTMEKQRALQAAVSAQQYGEQWLASNVTSSPPVDCSAQASTSTSTGTPIICTDILANSLDSGTTSNVPWIIGGGAVGYSYNPVNASTSTNYFPVNTSGGLNTYYAAPVMYISLLGQDATLPNAIDYSVDAWSYAGAQSTVAVVESTYQIRYTSRFPPL